MKPKYKDIIEKAGDPLWFDEKGVPRYVEFHPTHCVMTSAREAVLAEITCQGCGSLFLVAITRKNDPDGCLTGTGSNILSYGDPPNIGCCASGPTMTGDLCRIVEVWIRPEGPGYPWVKGVANQYRCQGAALLLDDTKMKAENNANVRC